MLWLIQDMGNIAVILGAAYFFYFKEREEEYTKEEEIAYDRWRIEKLHQSFSYLRK